MHQIVRITLFVMLVLVVAQNPIRRSLMQQRYLLKLKSQFVFSLQLLTANGVEIKLLTMMQFAKWLTLVF